MDALVFNLVFALVGTRRTFKKSALKKAAQVALDVANLDREQTQAAAYGYEIAAQNLPLVKLVYASKYNPFRDPNWRDQVVD
jgi:hypothetical protein